MLGSPTFGAWPIILIKNSHISPRSMVLCHAWTTCYPGHNTFTHWCLYVWNNEIAISDHSPISVTLRDSAPKPNAIMWRFPTHLTNDTQLNDMIKNEWDEYSVLNAQYTSHPILVWEAGKAHLRGRKISYVASQKKQQTRKFQEASDNLRQAQQSYTDDPIPPKQNTLAEMQNRFWYMGSEIWGRKNELQQPTLL